MNNFILGVMVAIVAIGGYLVYGDGDSVESFKSKTEGLLNSSVKKAETVVEKYQRKSAELKDLLVKTAVNRKLYARKIEQKRVELQSAESRGVSSEKIEILQKSVSEMETFQEKLVAMESRLKSTLLKHREGLDLLKMKIDYLESKREMLAIESSLNSLSAIDTDIKGVDSEIDRFSADLEKEIIQLETEIEVNKLLE
jgi:hypothetical protein